MSIRSTWFAALGILVSASFSPTPVLADSTDTSVRRTSISRAFFESAEYNKPCPLTVYSEDLSGTVRSRLAGLSSMHETALDDRATEAATAFSPFRSAQHGRVSASRVP